MLRSMQNGDTCMCCSYPLYTSPVTKKPAFRLDSNMLGKIHRIVFKLRIRLDKENKCIILYIQEAKSEP